MKLLRDLYSSLKARMTTKLYREPHEVELRSVKKTIPSPHREVHSRAEKMLAWCIVFNKRNGNIVPEKSPQSIYLRTHSGRRLAQGR